MNTPLTKNKKRKLPPVKNLLSKTPNDKKGESVFYNKFFLSGMLFWNFLHLDSFNLNFLFIKLYTKKFLCYFPL